ncbi:hypothetical protein PMPD1_0744 [Paramixta manurensis]|uniref:Uncharacterized protein n=1 Tax=Paramixta manurensis TaxID=2740817 RepID=A0A6M8U4Y6_9GAMM|nr:hypothetical protein PMPD1_0744 [Erwiniaceae bacterium PD-1]
MVKVIFSGYGIDIIENNGIFYIKYDDGGLISKDIESEIIKEEAIKAQLSSKDASEIIILTQKRDKINLPKI